MNTLKTIEAGRPDTGRIIQQVIYPSNRGIKDSNIRSHRNGMTNRAQAAANRRRSALKAELLIAENFRSGVDLYITLSYKDNPKDRDAALKYIQAFNKKMSASRRKRGLTYKYIYCTESKHDDGRWHHHIIINRGPESPQELEAIWGNGEAYVDRLKANYKKNSRSATDKTITNVAQYMCKEQPGKVGQRQWSRSRNLKPPKTERDSVPEGWLPEIPAKAIPIDGGSETGIYGLTYWIRYWLPAER